MSKEGIKATQWPIGTIRGPHHASAGNKLRYQFAVRTENGWVMFHSAKEQEARAEAEAFKASRYPDSSTFNGLFADAVEGLKEYYPSLKNAEVVAGIKEGAKKDFHFTGNNQSDYEWIRCVIEQTAPALPE